MALDGRPLDAGTASGTARTVDVEDYAVLFELDRLRAARLGGRGTCGAVARVHAFADEASRAGWLAGASKVLLRRDPRASVAVVCRAPLTARRITTALQAAGQPARLVFDGRFLPRGVQVSIVEEVRGLEFDYVEVPAAGGLDYPEGDAARRALYVAVTRARHQVVLACVRCAEADGARGLLKAEEPNAGA